LLIASEVFPSGHDTILLIFQSALIHADFPRANSSQQHLLFGAGCASRGGPSGLVQLEASRRCTGRKG